MSMKVLSLFIQYLRDNNLTKTEEMLMQEIMATNIDGLKYSKELETQLSGECMY